MNVEAIGELMDGKGELAGALANSEQRTALLLDQLRLQNDVLAEIHKLSDPNSKTPWESRRLIRTKAQVALRQVAQSGLLS